MEYIAFLHKESKSDFGVSFPDFPGCITAGKSLEEARQNAVQALQLHIAGMQEDGEKIPEPSTVDKVAHHPDSVKALAFLVRVPSEKTIRVNFTARESQIAKIDQYAQQVGLSRSAYMVQRSLRRVGRRQLNTA